MSGDAGMTSAVYGIDMSVWGHQLRPLILHAVGDRCARAGIDVDELVQQTALKILKANIGKHPYDPSKSRPTTYICMCARSALSHMVEKRRNRARWEQVGMIDPLTGEEGDAAAVEPTRRRYAFDPCA